MSKSIEERLQALEDERAIRQTVSEYSHGLDYGDETVFLNAFTEDAVLTFLGRETRGREELRAFFHRHTHSPDKFHKHFTGTQLLSIDGDVASCESYYVRIDAHEPEGTGAYLYAFGIYRDMLRRCADASWRIERRAVERESYLAPTPAP
jgi:uncharacterized protein (TIGR02246 family)